jgi:CRISPR-associated protein Cas2
VFVGRVSALVRDLLWEKVCREGRDGSALLIHTAPKEQGFALRLWGEPRRRVEDFEGLFLIRIPN